MITGTIGSKSLSGATYGWSVSNGTSYLGIDDGSYLQFENASGGNVTWGILVTDPTGPFAGEVICIGGGAGTNAGWTFSALSTLGKCPTIGAGTLTGCVR
jgi:hypothetical protein